MGRPPGWLLLLSLLCPAEAGGQSVATAAADSMLARGRVLFEAQCARCHGITGAGGQGPSLRRPRLRRAADDSTLTGVLRDGVPGTPMPGAWQLSDDEVRQLVAYVRSLGRLAPEPWPGDSGRGERLFSGAGGCVACHTVKGVGGVTGPELTEIGAWRSMAYLREALTDPGAAQPVRPLFTYPTGDYAGYLVVRVMTGAGRSVVGQRINEDPFTIQLRDGRGRLHSFEKRALRVIERQPRASLMPAVGERLSPAEIDDLVSYLASLRGAP